MSWQSGSESSTAPAADTGTRRPGSGHWLLRVVLLAVLGSCLSLAAQARYSSERAEYQAALEDLQAVRLQRFERRVESLQDYPLLPYLHYTRLLRYISSASPADIHEFRERFADTPLADRLLQEWLDNLARRGEWALYREHFDPEVATSTALRCRYYRALHETGDRDAAFEGAAEIWVAPRSLPDVCDPLFAAWRRHGDGPTDTAAWARINAALNAGNPRLATYLVRYLDEPHQALARSHIELHGNPARLQRVAAFEGPQDRVAEVVAHAVQRLARRDPALATELWTSWQARLELNGSLRSDVHAELVRWQLRRDLLPADFSQRWPSGELAETQDEALIEELLRHAIGRQDWSEVLAWLSHLSEAQRQQPGWRYWRARASLELAEPSDRSSGLIAVAMRNSNGTPLSEDAARAELADLATLRNYYGFLAARRLERGFALHPVSLELPAPLRSDISEHPALQRALELEALGETLDKRRELSWLRRQLEAGELLALAAISAEHGWHDQSIHATIAGRQWDHLDLRFPLAFADVMQAQAEQQGLDLAWMYAVARQESAFMTDARSSAGALGVMQLLPATARRTARELDIQLTSNWQLLDHRTNIRIGAAYLSQMADRYDGNRILASAAYNAGPNRVDRWVRERGDVPADVWIESIPFRETRNYVQNVLTYTVIYSHRLQREHPFLYSHEHMPGAFKHSS